MRRSFEFVVFALTCLLAVSIYAQPSLLPATGAGGPAKPEVKPGDSEHNKLQEKRDEVAEKLRVAQRTLDSAKDASAENNTKPPEPLQREVELLKLVDLLLAQQQTARDRQSEFSSRKADLEGQIETMRSNGPNDERPFSFLLLDQSRDELVEAKSREESIAQKVEAAKEAVQQAKEVYQEKERVRRQAKEALEQASDDAAKAKLAGALKIAEIESKVAAETSRLRELELANEEFSPQIHALSTQLLEAKIVWLEKDARFSQRNLNDRLADLEHQENELKQELESIQLSLSFIEQQWMHQRQQLTTATDNKALLTERLESLRLARQSKRLEVTVLNWRLQSIAQARIVWTRRFQLSTFQAKPADRQAWLAETERANEQLDRERRLNASEIDELRRDQANLDKRAQTAKDQSPETARELTDQRDSIQNEIRLLDSLIVAIEASRRLHEKLLNEIKGDEQSFSTSEWLAVVWQRIVAVWNYEVMSVDDRPITVSKIIGGIFLLFIGFLLSRWLSRWLGTRFLPRMGVNESATSALQSLAFYCLVATFTMMALQLVNVPLTVFTFLGGAIAIGVGFGSQNIVNNFISGLILLAERPIRVGDTIELDGFRGRIIQIGARSTRVLTPENLEIIVPNSTFLEKNVINWTLTDAKIRTSVTVGVAYGSSTREVARLLKRAAEEHGQVLGTPEPIVRFTDFGDNSLVFDLQVWIQLRSIAERSRIESDLRFRIDNLFNDAGIVIAFPQRDVHIDSLSPIQVRMVPPEIADDSTDSFDSKVA